MSTRRPVPFPTRLREFVRRSEIVCSKASLGAECNGRRDDGRLARPSGDRPEVCRFGICCDGWVRPGEMGWSAGGRRPSDSVPRFSRRDSGARRRLAAGHPNHERSGRTSWPISSGALVMIGFVWEQCVGRKLRAIGFVLENRSERCWLRLGKAGEGHWLRLGGMTERCWLRLGKAPKPGIGFVLTREDRPRSSVATRFELAS